MSFYSTRSLNIASELGGESCKRCQSPNKRIFDVFCCRAAAKRIVINFLSGKHFRSTLLLCHTRLHRKKERGISAGFTFSTCMITKQQEWILGLSEPFHLISLACSIFFPLYIKGTFYVQPSVLNLELLLWKSTWTHPHPHLNLLAALTQTFS